MKKKLISLDNKIAKKNIAININRSMPLTKTHSQTEIVPAYVGISSIPAYTGITNMPFNTGLSQELKEITNDMSNAINRIKLRLYKKLFSTSGKKTWLKILTLQSALAIMAANFAQGSLVSGFTNGGIAGGIANATMLLMTIGIAIPFNSMMSILSIKDMLSPNQTSKAETNDARLPSVTIQIPTYNEPFDVVKNTSLKSALEVDYPSEKLNIQIIDNSSSHEKYKEMKNYCKQLKAKGVSIEFIHRDGRDGGKAGNLNIGLGLKEYNDTKHQSKSDIFFLVDSDVMFPKNTLRNSTFEFVDNERLPFAIFETTDKSSDNLFNVPAGHINRLKASYTKVTEDAGSTTMGGYATLYRKSAIEEIGGWQEDYVGEDWATGFMMRANSDKWDKGLRINHTKAIDSTPDNLYKFKTQQKRWAKGTTETMRKIIFPKFIGQKHVPWNEKADAVTRLMNYPVASFMGVVQPTILATTGIIGQVLGTGTDFFDPVMTIWKYGLTFLIASVALPTAKTAAQGNVKNAFKSLALTPLAMINQGGIALNVTKGLIEGLSDKKGIFHVTPKASNQNENELILTFKQNWQEILFGATMLSIGINLPAPYSLCAFSGASHLISPFTHLYKFKQTARLKS